MARFVDATNHIRMGGAGETNEKKYVFTPSMGEISGFGGRYERACRVMLRSGLLWWDGHPTANPRFHTYKNIYGVCCEDNDDAKALSKAVVDAAKDCTGAMHQAVIGHIFFVRKHGWQKYVEMMTRRGAT